MSHDTATDDAISIGALAEATGLGVERIRMWERRYGYPQSIRRPSGHRRYPTTEITRLLIIKKVLELGHRAGDIATLSVDQLNELLQQPKLATSIEPAPMRAQCEFDAELLDWAKFAKQLDENKLTAAFEESCERLGVIAFISERLVPFLLLLDSEREQGRISNSEEHFTSEKIADFLSAIWRQLNGGTSGPPIVLTSLPGDIHRLGLQMCACIIALAKRRVVFIGPSSPIDEIVSSVKRLSASAVCVSITNSLTKTHAKDCLAQLLRGLPRHVPVVVGGEGSIVAEELRNAAPCHVTRITDFDLFHKWVSQLPLTA